MNETNQNSTYHMKYKDIVKQRAREYYKLNKEKIKESQRENTKK